MLNFRIPHLALACFIFMLIAQIGVLQIVAARRRWTGLSLGDYSHRPAQGYAIGAFLIVGSYAWFFLFHEQIFQPGPAGAELAFLFISALPLAIASSLFLAEARRWISDRKESQSLHKGREAASDLSGEEVALGAFTGRLFLPDQAVEVSAGAYPAVCIIPDPHTQSYMLQEVVKDLVGRGIAALLVEVQRNFPDYPEVLALLPLAVSFLSSERRVNSKRLGAWGFGIGGDVALRSASTDERIQAVAVVGPFLSQANVKPGLGILREMTYLQAMRWTRFRAREKLASELAAFDCISKLKAKSALLVFGEEDGLVPASDREAIAAVAPASVELRVVPGETHVTLERNRAVMHFISQWIEDRLNRDDRP